MQLLTTLYKKIKKLKKQYIKTNPPTVIDHILDKTPTRYLGMPDLNTKRIPLVMESAKQLRNEFGSSNIDSELVDKQYKNNIFEVNQGSIFCICTRDQFFKALDKIIQ